jgi:hypothetical protein
MIERKYKALADAFEALYHSDRKFYDVSELFQIADNAYKENLLNDDEMNLVDSWRSHEIIDSIYLRRISESSEIFKLKTSAPPGRYEFVSKFEFGALQRSSKEFSNERERQRIEEQNKFLIEQSKIVETAEAGFRRMKENYFKIIEENKNKLHSLEPKLKMIDLFTNSEEK